MATQSPLLFVSSVTGQAHVEPSVNSRWIFQEATQQRFATPQDVILIGPFDGGPPNVLVPYVDYGSMKDAYDPENLNGLSIDLASYLKSPSGDTAIRGAYIIYVDRIGQPTQASLTLQNATPAPAMVLTAVDYGAYTNGISVEVGTGSVAGKRIILRFRQEQTVLDNLANAFRLVYTGNATAATMTITRVGDRATRLETTLTGATDGSISLDVDLTSDSYATLGQLVTYLNGQNGYRCTLDTYGNALLPTAELDTQAGVNIRVVAALGIRYIGAGSAATMTTTNTTLTTTVAGGPGGENLALDFTTAGTQTLGEVIAAIDAHPAYTCSLGPNANPETLALAMLQNVTAQDIRTATYVLQSQPGKLPYVTTALLGSIVYAINTTSTRVTAARITGATLPPANIAQTFFAGGSSPTPTVNDWLNALEVVEQANLRGGFVFPVSSSAIVHDAVYAWILEQHTNDNFKFRGFFGQPTRQTPVQMKEAALGVQSTYTTSTGFGINAASGVTEQPPLYPAAMMCGAAAGALPTQPITKLVLRGRSLPSWCKFSKPVREDLLTNGVCTLEERHGTGVIISLAITTSRSTARLDRMLSESIVRDVIDERMRAYVETLIPGWASLDFVATVNARVIQCLQALERDKIITQGIQNGVILPAWKPPQITLRGGVLRITVQVFIGGEVDHIDIDGSIAYQTFELTITTAA